VVLADVGLAVGVNEIVTVIGPNGAGKTTLVKVILGLLQPDTGTVWRRPGLSVGYVPQRLAIDPILPLTVARLMTLTVRKSRDAVIAALAETGVAGLVDAAVSTLSGGELQRVMLARALIRNPDLLVLDEPVQGVDFAGEAALYDLIAKIRRRHGCGVLMVSHDLHVVMAATDRVLCLNHHVCCAGAPDAVSRHPEYLRLFGRELARTFAMYEHHHDHLHGISGEVVPLGDRDDHRADALQPSQAPSEAPSDPDGPARKVNGVGNASGPDHGADRL
jgi:zinc transport system ATP-binding protein